MFVSRKHKVTVLSLLALAVSVMAIMLVLGRGVVFAAEGSVTLGGLIDEALANNPRLRAERLALEAVKQKYPQARAYENPQFMYTEPIEEIQTRLGPQERVFSITQALPFPGKLGLKGDIAAKEIEVAQASYELAARELAAEVKKAYYDLFFIDMARSLATENESVLKYFEDVSRFNYGVAVSELDELVRAKLLSARASLDVIELDSGRSTVVARLNTLLDREAGSPIGVVAEPAFKPITLTDDELIAMAIKNYEGLKIASLKAEKSGLERRLAGYSYLPDFKVGFNYSEIGEPPMSVAGAGTDATAVTFGMSIPIWFGRNRAAVAGSEAELTRSMVMKGALTNEIKNSVKRVYFDVVTSEKVVRLYGDKFIPEAEEAYSFAEARYKAGKEKLGRLLEAESMWINFRLVYYRALRDYLKGLSELERLSNARLD